MWAAGILSSCMLIICNKSFCELEILFVWNIICVFIQIALCVHIYSLKIKNKMYFKIEYFYMVILCFLECINIISYKFDIIDILLETIGLFNFLLIFMFTIKNQIKNPYKVLIKILKKENDELDELNKEVILKNEELEKLYVILKQKEELNHAFFRFMPHPMVILNSENNRIIFANKRFLDLIEVDDPRKIINKKIKKYMEFVPDINERDFDAILYVREKRKYLKKEN